MKDLIIPRTKFAEPETNSPKANNSKCVTDNRKNSDVGRINLRSRSKLFKWVFSCSRLTFESGEKKSDAVDRSLVKKRQESHFVPATRFRGIIHYADFATPHTLVLQLERARRPVM